MFETGEKLNTPPKRKLHIGENIDPKDRVLNLLLPKMTEEHITRYSYVFDYIKEHFPKLTHEDLTILDVASGRGYGASILAEEFPKANVLGVELVGRSVQKAERNYGKKQSRINFLQGDARLLPFANKSIDIATAFEITEHLAKEDQPAFVMEITRVLKDNGVAFISVPHRYSFEETKHGKVVRTPLWSNPYHLYEPTSEEVKSYIQSAGLKLIGEFGQIVVPQEEAEKMKRLSKIAPIWSILAWKPKRDVSVASIPKGKVGLTHIFVVQKPT